MIKSLGSVVTGKDSDVGFNEVTAVGVGEKADANCIDTDAREM